MSVAERIAHEFTTALKAGNRDKVSVLRLIKSAIKNKEIDKGSPLSEDEVQAVLRTFVKRAKESIDQYVKAGRKELADKEERERAVIEEFLPKQASEAEVREAVSAVISELGAVGIKDMGRVMKGAMARLQGAAEGRLVNTVAKELLEN
jgi:uncharacterized protein YqeY